MVAGMNMHVAQNSFTPFTLREKTGPDPRSGPHDDAPDPDKTPEPSAGEGGRRLVCKACRTRITRRDLGMEIDGKHHHVFFNPHGYVFELGCFASAKNVIPTGPRTDEFTWFPGYAWQVVACAGCNSQLGWRYISPTAGGFFGLILNALIEEPEE